MGCRAGGHLGAQAPVGESDDMGHRARPGPRPEGRRRGPGRSTNPIESMISVCREHAGNVKRWRDGKTSILSARPVRRQHSCDPEFEYETTIFGVASCRIMLLLTGCRI